MIKNHFLYNLSIHIHSFHFSNLAILLAACVRLNQATSKSFKIMFCRLLSLTIPPRDLKSHFHHYHNVTTTTHLHKHLQFLFTSTIFFSFPIFVFFFFGVSFNIPLWIWLSISQVNFKLIYFDVRSDQKTKSTLWTTKTLNTDSSEKKTTTTKNLKQSQSQRLYVVQSPYHATGYRRHHHNNNNKNNIWQDNYSYELSGMFKMWQPPKRTNLSKQLQHIEFNCLLAVAVAAAAFLLFCHILVAGCLLLVSLRCWRLLNTLFCHIYLSIRFDSLALIFFYSIL